MVQTKRWTEGGGVGVGPSPSHDSTDCSHHDWKVFDSEVQRFSTDREIFFGSRLSEPDSVVLEGKVGLN